MRLSAGSTEIEREAARERWNAENPKRPAVAVQWAGGHTWQVVCLSGGPGFVDMTPIEPRIGRQLSFDTLKIQPDLF